MDVKISLLTREFSPAARLGKSIERYFNKIKYRITGNRYKEWTCSFPIGGHQDVVSSFLKGSVSYPDAEILINPDRKEVEGSSVYIPGNWRALRDSIPLREKGIIKKLAAGPNVCTSPAMHDSLAINKSIDVYLVASDWVLKIFSAMSDNKMNIKVWPAGVDHLTWKPERETPDEAFSKSLIYVKQSGQMILPQVENTLRMLSKEIRIINYGHHIPSDYKTALEWCDFAVVLGESETQGLALSQAWSMNRPTLVYNNPDFLKYTAVVHGLKRTFDSSMAPYMTEATGRFWNNIDEIGRAHV